LATRKRRQLADVLYTTSPQGENTLIVRNGKRALLKALLKAKRLDKVEGDEEVAAMIGDILVSPVLKKVFCGKSNFAFTPRSMIVAKLDRAELGDFDALVLGLVLIGHYKGQIIVPDFGSAKLRSSVMLIKDTEASATTADDADLLAIYHSGFTRGQDGFTSYVTAAMS
jgi:hypothetical protein